MIDLAVITLVAFEIMVFSVPLFKVNFFSRLAERTLVAVAISNLIVISIQAIMAKGIQPILNGNTILIIPVIFGALTLTRLYKKTEWIGMLPVVTTIGIITGVAFTGVIQPQIIDQISATMFVGFDIYKILIFIVAIICSTYFLFTLNKEKQPLKTSTKLARYLIMIGLGAFFANTVASRIGNLSGMIIEILEKLGLSVI